MKKIFEMLVILGVGVGLNYAVGRLFDKKKEDSKPKNYVILSAEPSVSAADCERNYQPYVDERGRYHEPIGGGVYAVWHSYETYLDATKEEGKR